MSSQYKILRKSQWINQYADPTHEYYDQLRLVLVLRRETKTHQLIEYFVGIEFYLGWPELFGDRVGYCETAHLDLALAHTIFEGRLKTKFRTLVEAL